MLECPGRFFKMSKFPTSKEIIEEALKLNPKANINQLHELTFIVMKKSRETYYREKVEELFNNASLKKIPELIKLQIKKVLLRPIEVEEIIYSNFMEEASRRISQTFQVISGNLAELCAERELNALGLKEGVDYKRKVDHTDIVLYFPTFKNYTKKHRIEVKNVKLRERATRGLTFDGDSMMGFFNDPTEFTKFTIETIEAYCKSTGGYCYVPQTILAVIKVRYKIDRFKSNEDLASDAKKFVKEGAI